MVRELLNVSKIDNGFILTTCIGDTHYCTDEEAVAAFVRQSLAAIAVSGGKPSRSALTPAELDELWKAAQAGKKDEGQNA